MEKIKVKRKKLGTTKKLRLGNYRINYYLTNKHQPIGSVKVGCYVDGSSYDTVGAITRNLLRLHYLGLPSLRERSLERFIFVTDINELVLKKSSYIDIGLSFAFGECDGKFQKDCWDDITQRIINIVENSKLSIVDK